MRPSLPVSVISLAIVIVALGANPSRALDVVRKRFSPPRIYFSHSSLNKNGVTSAIKGQVNFIDVYMTPIDNASGRYTPEGFTYSLLLPAFVRIDDAEEQGLTIERVDRDGAAYLRITKSLDARQVDIRSLRGHWGSSHEWIWYRIDADQSTPDDPAPIELSLHFKGERCYTDTSRLKVYEALEAPRLPAKDFKLWLHYGPRYRMDKLDELADYMAKAGFNAIQSLESVEFDNQMRERGFYIIHQRPGSYHSVYENEFHDCITEGPSWFGKVKNAAMDDERLRVADATIFDFEPGPAGRISEFRDQPWLHERFRKIVGLPADTPLTEELIKTKYFKQWIDMRQDLAAQVVRNWAAYCRSVNPKIDTIICQGTPHDITSNIDYARYADDVTYVDPMNFTRAQSLAAVKKWIKRSPRAQFTGCQNVCAGGYANVFIGDQEMMLQTLGAAMIGGKGTSFYSGWALDAANFVLFNRVMSFMARHRQIMFDGEPDPDGMILTAIPKEDTQIDLGGGTKIRNVHPDWDHDATIRGYFSRELNEYLAVVNNLNTTEPCYVKLTAAVEGGPWLLVDDEHKKIFRFDGDEKIASMQLANGVYLHSPPLDFRGYRLIPVSSSDAVKVASYAPVDLAPIGEKARAYRESGQAFAEAVSRSDVRLGFDDFDRDNQFEYLVETPGQKVWVSRSGTIRRWKIGELQLRTRAMGMASDQIWLPQSERNNGDAEAVMRLVDKRVGDDGVELVFTKGVNLASMGAMVSLRMTKTLSFSTKPGSAKVTVTFFNDSLSMEVPAIDLSYRVHHYINHEKRGRTVSWVYDGADLSTQHAWQNSVVLNEQLSDEEKLNAWTKADLVRTQAFTTFGEYYPHRRLLLSFGVDDASRVLQLLTWRPENSQEPAGTAEWMYRPVNLAQGKQVTFEYDVTLAPGVDALTPQVVARSTQSSAKHEQDARLLFHLDFADSPNAVIAKGESGKAKVIGLTQPPTYEKTPNGKGIYLPLGASLAYTAKGNINVQQGRFEIRFKPLWHGGDGETKYFMQVNPRPGFMYFGFLNDGRFLCNMFDITGEQHWPGVSLKHLEPGAWHHAVATWDAAGGTIQLFFDGEKVAQTRGKPWSMGQLQSSGDPSRLIIGGAPIVIDEIKIWDRP